MEQLDESTKKRLLYILECSYKHDTSLLNESDVSLLFYWQRHKDNPEFKFVPRKYYDENYSKKKNNKKAGK